MIKDVLISSFERKHVLNHIRQKKISNPNYKVIDIGGFSDYTEWSYPVVDYIVNFDKCEIPGKEVFAFNLNFETQWAEILNFVDQNGKFDFCICSHTLEDLALPSVALQKMPQIAKEGFVATPSKFRELSKVGDQSWLGYIHHRWIFTFKDGIYLALPKLNFIERTSGFELIGNSAEEICDLSFFWEHSIEFKILNDDYMGPTVGKVLSYYNVLFNDDLGLPLNPELNSSTR
jgi:hypothetical protein